MEQKFYLRDKKNDEVHDYGRPFTKEEARRELATIYYFDAYNEGLNSNEMTLEELLNEDWELCPAFDYVYRKENNGLVGTGYVRTQPEGFMITYMTFDGYVDDGYFDTADEAIKVLNEKIIQAEKTAVEFSKRADVNGGMY